MNTTVLHHETLRVSAIENGFARNSAIRELSSSKPLTREELDAPTNIVVQPPRLLNFTEEDNHLSSFPLEQENSYDESDSDSCPADIMLSSRRAVHESTADSNAAGTEGKRQAPKEMQSSLIATTASNDAQKSARAAQRRARFLAGSTQIAPKEGGGGWLASSLSEFSLTLSETVKLPDVYKFEIPSLLPAQSF